jgi:dienelactone hydrolase
MSFASLEPHHIRQLAANLRRSRRSVLAGTGSAGLLAAMSGFATAAQSPEASSASSTPAAGAGYKTAPQVFASDFNFDFLVALGSTYERAADIGECFAAASQIEDGNYESWVAAWLSMAGRLNGIGQTAEAAGHTVSAGEAFLRASTYYGLAQWFTLGTSQPDRITTVWTQHKDAFEGVLRNAGFPTETLDIPYRADLPIPAYALLVDDSGEQRPWVILTNGSDGGYPESWAAGASAALRRGYNALIFDGPGQNAMLFENDQHFIADWEKVVTPIVDYLLTRTDVDPDKLVLTGVSQGGYWAPRAAAFEKRLAAVVADPGVVQVWQSWASQMPPGAIEGLFETTGAEQEQTAKELDEGVAEYAAKDPELAFAVAFRTYPYGTDSLSNALLQAKAMDLTDAAKDITIPILILDPEGEQFWPGESQQLYDMAGSANKKLVTFTAAEGADLHCEPKAIGLRNQVVFDWLDEVLER